MGIVNTVYQQKWPGYATLILGLVVGAVGIRTQGDSGGDLLYLSLLICLTGYARISHQAICARLRIAYRYGRTEKSGGPVLVSFPRREDAIR